MAVSDEKELPLWGSKCPVCGLGMLSWSKEHVGELLAVHWQTEHQAEHDGRMVYDSGGKYIGNYFDRRYRSMKRPPPR